tara:strand:+ start:220 stop:408 length:189 start_codon:yes stop_codon:yes gene_type:complete
MKTKKYQRKKSIKKALEKIETIKKDVPKIVFTAKNIIVTLSSKRQLNRWLEIYPDGKYQINI